MKVQAPEFHAMAVCQNMLSSLDYNARVRVLSWINQWVSDEREREENAAGMKL